MIESQVVAFLLQHSGVIDLNNPNLYLILTLTYNDHESIGI